VRRGQKNVLAVEVHQAAVTSSDLFLDLALKVCPAHALLPDVPVAAQEVTNTYHQRHYVGPGLKIPDGYLDGGRRMAVDANHRATSDREILQVERSRDVELARDLAFARSREIQDLPILERIQRIAARIDKETTPPGGPACILRTAEQLEQEFRNQSILIGDWIDQGQAGVCRHRSLLFKILADEAGLNVSLVRGNYVEQGSPSIPHAWNEVFLGDGRRVLIDVTLEGSQPRFLEVGTPEVIQHYLKVDNTPWYGTKAD
jgi:Ethylene-responsive protein kinase Le-CTR1